MADWSDDEIVIAMEFYHTCAERMHTDSHAKCKEIAGLLGRSPGALDKIIRNIKIADTGAAGLPHASSSIRRLVRRYHNDLAALRQRAAQIRQAHGWPPLDCGN